MSNKSTLFLRDSCHIYYEKEFTDGEAIEKLCIDVAHDCLDDHESIQVLWDSEFSTIIRSMIKALYSPITLKTKTDGGILKMVDSHGNEVIGVRTISVNIDNHDATTADINVYLGDESGWFTKGRIK